MRALPAAASLEQLAEAYGGIRQQYREEYIMYGLAQAALAQALPRMQVRYGERSGSRLGCAWEVLEVALRRRPSGPLGPWCFWMQVVFALCGVCGVSGRTQSRWAVARWCALLLPADNRMCTPSGDIARTASLPHKHACLHLHLNRLRCCSLYLP